MSLTSSGVGNGITSPSTLRSRVLLLELVCVLIPGVGALASQLLLLGNVGREDYFTGVASSVF
jgi:hypothetical protein